MGRVVDVVLGRSGLRARLLPDASWPWRWPEGDPNWSSVSSIKLLAEHFDLGRSCQGYPGLI
jgi:hypothetical protein